VIDDSAAIHTRLCRLRADSAPGPRDRNNAPADGRRKMRGLRVSPAMRRQLAGGIELDDDRARIDIDAVHDFLANHSYWAKGRDRATVERLVRNSQRVVGVYAGERQIGFARVFTDDASFAYLADVYVLPEYRGTGIGVELVREAVDNGPFARRRWLLHTRDAHDLYRRFGFGEPSQRLMERPPAPPPG
jgi:GNAT superfamily N-acetyltransferase